MTALDTSVAHYPVLMVLGPHETPREVTLADGYRFEPWDPRHKDAWVRLHVTLGQLPSIEEGLSYFERTYEADPEALGRQMVLVCDDSGALVGTSSVWAGEHFGERRLRVHWVGVDPAHQRRGIARALVLRTIALFDELVPSGEPPLYLTTQTESWVACGLYLSLGFAPYRGAMPPRFSACPETFEEDNERAWRIIANRLGRRLPEPGAGAAGGRGGQLP